MKVILPKSLENFIDTQMRSFKCATHDVAHCYRVANLAYTIAQEEPNADSRLAYIAGSLHDVLDSKLVTEDNAMSSELTLRQILASEPDFVSATETERIIMIIKSVGYKNIIREDWKPMELSVEYRCVQDADLLDAIGAVGIARCFAYGGKKNRRMFGVTKNVSAQCIGHEAYMAARDAGGESGVDHFFDKLLRIPDKMLTTHGRTLANERRLVMVSFLKQLDVEMEQSGDPDAGKIQTALVSMKM